MSSPDPELPRIHIALLASALSLRLGLQALLSADPDFSMEAEASSADDLEPDLSQVTVLVAAGRGVAGMLDPLLQNNPGLGLLLLVEEPVSPELLSRFPAGAWGILSLDASPEELSAAVRAVHQGLWVGDPSLTARLFNRPEAPFSAPDGEQVEPLTPRELEVLQQLALGLANKQIGAVLKMSENTVKYHISSIYTKFGAGNRAEAVRIGARRGLISL